jgi:hypothetical protein
MFNHSAAIIVDIGRNSIKITIVKIHGEVIATKSWPLNSYENHNEYEQVACLQIANKYAYGAISCFSQTGYHQTSHAIFNP